MEKYCPMCGTELNEGNCPNCGYRSSVSTGTVVPEQGDLNSTGSTIARSRKKTIIPILIVAVVVAAIVVVLLVVKPNDKPAPIVNNEEVEEPRVIQTGDIIMLGSYEQDNNTGNGSEAIEWIVLDKSDNNALLISRYVLDAQPFSRPEDPNNWEECYLRRWLNDDFYRTAFSDDEAVAIIETSVIPESSPDSVINTGNETVDRLFLLNMAEVNQYFPNAQRRLCLPTQYSIANGVWTNSSGYGEWWLRTPALIQSGDAVPVPGGAVYSDGTRAINSPAGVRPAMWVDLTMIDITQVQAASSSTGGNSGGHPVNK